jgi:hypothetical protein
MYILGLSLLRNTHQTSSSATMRPHAPTPTFQKSATSASEWDHDAGVGAVYLHLPQTALGTGQLHVKGKRRTPTPEVRRTPSQTVDQPTSKATAPSSDAAPVSASLPAASSSVPASPLVTRPRVHSNTSRNYDPHGTSQPRSQPVSSSPRRGCSIVAVRPCVV